MQYRHLGSSGLRVSELCMGTMTFGHKLGVIGVVGQEEADALVRVALDAGVNFFDSADAYSEGESEQILGKALKNAGAPRESVVIATKVRSPMSEAARQGRDVNNVGLSRKHVIEGCDASLRRLGIDYIDLYQIHGLDATTPIEETLGAMDDLVRQGKVLYTGCSNIASRHVMRSLWISDRRGLARFTSLQAYYSLVARDLELELLPLCREEGLGVMVWSPLSGGYLSGKYRSGQPEAGRRNTFDFPPISPEAPKALSALEEIASARGTDMARTALAWLLKREGISSVLVGARNVEQLQDNLAAADLELSAEEIETLSAATEPLPIYPNWMIERQAGMAPVR
jgi:aryl-alcohol dehydrogenase-like predicted oxidoreductase